MVSRNLGFRFTLVSYNILSQTLLNDHSYLYSSCNPKDLEWPKRGHRIVTELLNNQADIICLQEVESEHLQSLYRPKLAKYGYECLYKKKTGYKIDGCAIFYKRKSFHLLDFKGIEFNRTDVANLLNRDNVGIIAVLEPKFRHRQSNNNETHQQNRHQQQLVIANTHLIFNPKRSDIKLAQLKLFLSELEEISFKQYDSIKDERHHHPTILCGDLNSVPGSDVNHFIMRKQLDNTSSLLNQRNPEEGNTKNDVDDNDDHDDDEATEGATPPATSVQHRRGNTNDQSNSEQRVRQLSAEEKEVEDEDEEDLNYLNRASHPFQFKSVYPNQNRRGQPFVSTFSSCIVDYIFYTPKQLRLHSYRELLTEGELKNIGPIPNSEFPSDHLTLWAKFILQS